MNNPEIGITTSEGYNITIGDTVKYTPDLSQEYGFFNSNVGKMMSKHNITHMLIEFIPQEYDLYGFSYILRFVKEDGSYLTTFEYLNVEPDPKQDSKEDINKPFTEILSDYGFLNYLTAYNWFQCLDV